MKILFIDLMSPMGHKNYNYGILKALSKHGVIDVILRRDFLDFENNGINVNEMIFIPDNYIPEILINKYKNLRFFKIGYRINQIKCLKWIKDKIDLNKYDLVFFSSVDIISFSLVSRFLKCRCVFVDHAISDIDYSYLKRKAWTLLNENLEIIVLEPYIEDYLREEIGVKNKIWTLPHPLPNIKEIDSFQQNPKNEKRKVIFAPSLSNNEEFIEELIEKSGFIPDDVYIVIKSKKNSLESKNIKVYNSRISDEEYYHLMHTCDFMLLAYDNKYNYKTSGIFFESAKLKKPIILSANNTLMFYKNKYSGIINEFNEFIDFLDVLNHLDEINEIQKKNEDFGKVLFDYSDEVISNKIFEILMNN
ncbi:hypothetical protein [Paenibacillus sp. NPDC058177]|uniref:hypothetical protein n=1 Tax=Paenibacillus sp. NPDC058177 TaxID=3346369 RepID=UPI0036D8D7A5